MVCTVYKTFLYKDGDQECGGSVTKLRDLCYHDQNFFDKHNICVDDVKNETVADVIINKVTPISTNRDEVSSMTICEIHQKMLTYSHPTLRHVTCPMVKADGVKCKSKAEKGSSRVKFKTSSLIYQKTKQHLVVGALLCKKHRKEFASGGVMEDIEEASKEEADSSRANHQMGFVKEEGINISEKLTRSVLHEKVEWNSLFQSLREKVQYSESETRRLQHPESENRDLQHPESENRDLPHPESKNRELQHPEGKNRRRQQPESENKMLHHRENESNIDDKEVGEGASVGFSNDWDDEISKSAISWIQEKVEQMEENYYRLTRDLQTSLLQHEELKTKNRAAEESLLESLIQRLERLEVCRTQLENATQNLMRVEDNDRMGTSKREKLVDALDTAETELLNLDLKNKNMTCSATDSFLPPTPVGKRKCFIEAKERLPKLLRLDSEGSVAESSQQPDSQGSSFSNCSEMVVEQSIDNFTKLRSLLSDLDLP